MTHETPKNRSRLMDGYMTAQQTAHELGISLRTLYRLWAHGDGPPRLKLGGRNHVPIEESKSWLKSRLTCWGGMML